MSAITDHAVEENHVIDWDKVKMVDREAQRQTRWIKEALWLRKKVKEVDLYSTLIVVPHTQCAQVRITQCYLQITPYLPLPRKHSPDGASPE